MGVISAQLFAVSGCLEPVLGYDVHIVNQSEDELSGSIEIIRDDSGKVVLDEEFELASSGEQSSVKYERIGASGVNYSVSVSTDSGLSEDARWSPQGYSRTTLRVLISGESISIGGVVR